MVFLRNPIINSERLPVNFEDSIKKTVLWTLKNQEWLEEL